MNKTIVTIILIAVGITGLMWWGKSIQNPAATPGSAGDAASVLVASEESYDFGAISMKNGLVNHTFKITNSSAEEVLVKKITTSCMCTEAYIESEGKEKGPFSMEGMGYIPSVNVTIKAGESRDVKVVYDPNAHGPAGVGAINRLVYIADASGGVFQLEIKALVTP